MRNKIPEGFAYSSTEQWLLDHGQFWTPSLKTTPMRANRCFDNAFDRAWKTQRRRNTNDRFRYVEGWALTVIPVHHAWCIDGQDRVVELTWRHPGLAYFGAVFTIEEVQARRHVGREVSLLDDWERDYPLLKKASA